ncbi:MAG: CDGSH iron-sulfur domain-containing protein [Cyanobacteriota bacterium]
MAVSHPETGPKADRVLGPEPLTLPAGVHHLCSCGLSRQGWWCDGAHLGTGRVSYELRLERQETVWLCRCGRSRRHPLCDGSHARGRGRDRPWWRRWF